MSRAISLSELNALNEELATLVAARAPLEPHLRDVARRLHGRPAGLAERLRERLSSGEDLADAVDAEGDALPAAYRAVVRAGARSGRLPSALEAVVAASARVDEYRRFVGLSMLYPALLLVAAWVLGCIVAFTVAPRFDWINGTHFAALRGLAGSPSAELGIAIAGPAVVALAAVIWWRRSGGAGWAYGARGWSLAQWGLGAAVRRYSQWAVFAELLRLMVGQRAPLGEALRVAADVASDGPLARVAHELADRVDRGASLAELSQQGATQGLPPLVRIALAMAQDPPAAERGLGRAAEAYGERAARLSSEAADLLPIFATALIAAPAVLLFALAVFWPYVSALRQMASGLWS